MSSQVIKYYINKHGEKCIFVAGQARRTKKLRVKIHRLYSKLRNKQLLLYIALRSCCQDCGTRIKLTFDHVRGKKEFNIKDGPKKTFKLLNEELLKCEIVCRKCHDKWENVRKVLLDGIPTEMVVIGEYCAGVL